jgi:hypothetical protein
VSVFGEDLVVGIDVQVRHAGGGLVMGLLGGGGKEWVRAKRMESGVYLDMTSEWDWA